MVAGEGGEGVVYPRIPSNSGAKARGLYVQGWHGLNSKTLS